MSFMRSNSHLNGQKFSRILWNPDVYYRDHNIMQLDLYSEPVESDLQTDTLFY
jgi:hypothetical protein